MINFLTWANVPNPSGIPSAWPAQVEQVKDGSPAPKAPWQQLGDKEFSDYVASNQAAFDAWKASQDSAKTASLASLQSTYDGWISQLNTFAGIGSPTQAQINAAVKQICSALQVILPLLREQYVQSKNQ